VERLRALDGVPGSVLLRRLCDDRPLATLVRRFLLGTLVEPAAARAGLGPLPLEAWAAAELIERSPGSVRAADRLVAQDEFLIASGQSRTGPSRESSAGL